MRFLFLHPNFPAQFRHLAVEIAKQEQHQVVFGTARVDGSLPGVHKEIYAPNREVRPETHNYIKPLASAVLQGQAVPRPAPGAAAVADRLCGDLARAARAGHGRPAAVAGGAGGVARGRGAAALAVQRPQVQLSARR